jgi:hypothetical protein
MNSVRKQSFNIFNFKLALISILLSLPTYVLANQGCGEKIEIETKYMPKNNQQKDLSWCFAWTATDLFSFHEEVPLSSYDLGFQYHNHDVIREAAGNVKDFTLKGGVERLALIIGIQSKKGICTEEQTNFKDGDWEKLSDYFKLLASPKRSLKSIVCNKQTRMDEPFNELTDEVVLILNKLSRDKKAAALLDVVCQKRHTIKNKYGLGYRLAEDYTPDEVIEKLDELLEKGQPASVAYDADFIFKGAKHKRKTSNHSSTIIGRRTNDKTGMCEYLIKNSWGDKCPKKAKMECIEGKGHYWVPRHVFKNNVYDINWLEYRGKKSN